VQEGRDVVLLHGGGHRPDDGVSKRLFLTIWEQVPDESIVLCHA
jgi:hypothetical protein